MTRNEIEEFIAADINPALEMHGGYLSVEGYNEDDKVLHVTMGGGCQGCAASSITLKLQIEATLKEQFPELTQVIDTTDHTSGINPYY